MEFRTQVPIRPEEPKINYDSQIFLVGSCFVENIGRKLEYFKFRSLINPFGILFHPAAIRNFLEKVGQKKEYTEADIFYHNELWHSFDAHSDLNATQKGEILARLNLAVEESHNFLKKTSHVILTPGTAWGYRAVDSDKIVANCHKLPQKNFKKELNEVEEDLQACVELIKDLNPSAEIIFTVSPVRHLKDGFVENQQSKARLISAVHKVISEDENSGYFPAFEIMMDELRDYRFYAEDMLHPSSVAIDYIWQKFKDCWICSEAEGTMKEIDAIQKGLSHEPFYEKSEAHQKFLRNLEKRIKDLRDSHPNIQF